jgi:signal transduction histidine kinase
MDAYPVMPARLMPGPARARRPVFGLDWLNEDWQPSPARDAILAVILTVIAVYASYEEAHPQVARNYFTAPYHLPHTPSAAFLLPAAAGLVLAWRHRQPRLVLCASAAATVAYSAAGWVNGGIVLMPAIALGTVAAMVPARSAIAWALGLLVVLGTASVVNNPLGPLGGGVVVLPGTLTITLLAGIAIRNRRAYAGSLRRQAERDAQYRIDEERLRIARELHDVVAHTMATITVQAAAASQLLPASPDRAAESLAAIRAASKEGLRELGAILDVMRHAGDPPDAVAPAGGLARLDALAEGVRRSGVPVTVTVAGEPRPLPAVTGLSAFRIIQEALTNTVRHAGPARASVTVRYGPGDLRIEVSDDGRGGTAAGSTSGPATGPVSPAPSAAPSTGHGLQGMRERAAAAGGTLEAGPIASGGFRVAAWFPCRPDATVATLAALEAPATPPPPATPSRGGPPPAPATPLPDAAPPVGGPPPAPATPLPDAAPSVGGPPPAPGTGETGEGQ